MPQSLDMSATSRISMASSATAPSSSPAPSPACGPTTKRWDQTCGRAASSAAGWEAARAAHPSRRATSTCCCSRAHSAHDCCHALLPPTAHGPHPRPHLAACESAHAARACAVCFPGTTTSCTAWSWRGCFDHFWSVRQTSVHPPRGRHRRRPNSNAPEFDLRVGLGVFQFALLTCACARPVQTSQTQRRLNVNGPVAVRRASWDNSIALPVCYVTTEGCRT